MKLKRKFALFVFIALVVSLALAACDSRPSTAGLTGMSGYDPEGATPTAAPPTPTSRGGKIVLEGKESLTLQTAGRGTFIIKVIELKNSLWQIDINSTTAVTACGEQKNACPLSKAPGTNLEFPAAGNGIKVKFMSYGVEVTYDARWSVVTQ